MTVNKNTLMYLTATFSFAKLTKFIKRINIRLKKIDQRDY